MLILTEGDSAKALAVAGWGVVGRDNFGVFPLRGKMLNVRCVWILGYMRGGWDSDADGFWCAVLGRRGMTGL